MNFNRLTKLFLKGLPFLALLLIYGNSYADTYSPSSVMDVIERTEDYYVSFLNKMGKFFCGERDQKMDTEVGISIKRLFCGKEKQRIKASDEQDSFLNSESEQFSEIPDFDFAIIKSDTFTMGSPKGEKDRESDENQVEVTISKAFEMTKTEVTQLQWFSVMRDNPSYFSEEVYCEDDYMLVSIQVGEVGLCPNHPVERVSWKMTQDFIKELNKRGNLQGCDETPKSESGCYRLPTEAEWELAARARSKTVWFFGNDVELLKDHAWYDVNSNSRTHEVGLKIANDNELYDVYGNVSEWVQDKYVGKLSGGTDPLHKSGWGRVFRGGSWISDVRYLRSAFRNADYTDYADDRGSSVGFRLARSL